MEPEDRPSMDDVLRHPYIYMKPNPESKDRYAAYTRRAAGLDVEDEDDDKQETEIDDEEMTAAEDEDHQEPTKQQTRAISKARAPLEIPQALRTFQPNSNAIVSPSAMTTATTIPSALLLLLLELVSCFLACQMVSNFLLDLSCPELRQRFSSANSLRVPGSKL